MSKLYLVFFILSMMMFISISGCIGNEKDAIDHDIPDHINEHAEVPIDDIWLTVTIRWEEDINSSYVLFPNLMKKDREIVFPINQNITQEATEYGMCQNYSFQPEEYYKREGKAQSGAYLVYVEDGSDLSFTSIEYLNDMPKQFHDNLGLSIWEEEDGKVYTRIFTSEKAIWIRIDLMRGDRQADHDTDFAYVPVGLYQEVSGDGWHKIELEGRIFWASLD